MSITPPPLDFPVSEAAIAARSGVALAVSGGSDSLAIMHLVHEHWRRCGLSVPLVVLTVDHGLRHASAEEAEQVTQWSTALDLRHVSLHWQGEKPATGIQAAARQARYNLMSSWCHSAGFDTLLTAHTLNDQAETVAMRKRRTQSAHSLAAIWPETTWQGIALWRPLLKVSREELRAYLRSLGQTWIDDPSNRDRRYERVRVREALMDKDIMQLAHEAERARAEAQALAGEVTAWCAANSTVSAFGHVQVSRQKLAALSPVLQAEVLRRLIGLTGSGSTVNRRATATLVAALQAGESFRRSLGGAIVAARQKDILVGREAGRIGQEAVLSESGACLWDGRFLVSGPPGARVRAAGKARPPAVHDLPGFVVEALPVVEIPAGGLVFPHFEARNGCGVTPSERILP
jgi:tRNA(Ile)-lysidine synthase